MRRRPGTIRAAMAVSTALALSGCKDEQRYYTYQDETGPGVPSQIAGQPMVENEQGAAPPAGMPPMMAGAAGSAGAADWEAVAPPAGRELLSADEMEKIEIIGLEFPVGADWQQQAPASTMRVMQFALPAPDGGEPGELAGFFFGPPPGGGTTESNIDRWIGQVDPDEAPVVYESETNGLKVTELYVRGTLQPSGMGTGPTTPQPDSALYGIIIEGGPEGTLFLKATGPRSVIDPSLPAFATLATQVTPAQS